MKENTSHSFCATHTYAHTRARACTMLQAASSTVLGQSIPVWWSTSWSGISVTADIHLHTHTRTIQLFTHAGAYISADRLYHIGIVSTCARASCALTMLCVCQCIRLHVCIRMCVCVYVSENH